MQACAILRLLPSLPFLGGSFFANTVGIVTAAAVQFQRKTCSQTGNHKYHDDFSLQFISLRSGELGFA